MAFLCSKRTTTVLLLMLFSGYVGYLSRDPVIIQVKDDSQSEDLDKTRTRNSVEPSHEYYECPREGPSDNKYCIVYNYKRLLSPRLTCEGNVTLLLMVTSVPKNFQQRKILRRTWCSDLDFKYGSVRHVFLLGNTTSDVQAELEREAQEYGDILQDDFRDSYRNLTLKTIMAFHWFGRHCSNAKYFMKSDNDMFVNTVGILKMVHEAPQKFNYTLFGYCFTYPRRIMRLKKNKWYVPYAQYPGRWWPRYCEGTGYVLESTLARGVDKIIPTVPLITTEDAFVGECVQRLDGRVLSISSFSRYSKNLLDEANIRNFKSGEKLSIHRANIKQMESLWNITLSAWNK